MVDGKKNKNGSNNCDSRHEVLNITKLTFRIVDALRCIEFTQDNLNVSFSCRDYRHLGGVLALK